MNEAELIEALQGFLSETTQLVFGYITVMSGFLIMSYLAAHKIPRSLAILVGTLFTAVSGVLMFRLYLIRMDTQELIKYIFEQKAAGNLDLEWFGTSPAWAPTVLAAIEITAILGGFLGCLVFFVYRRFNHDDA